MDSSIKNFVNSINNKYFKIKGMHEFGKYNNIQLEWHKKKAAGLITNYIIEQLKFGNILYYYVHLSKRNLIKSLLLYYNESDRNILNTCDFTDSNFLEKLTENCNNLELTNLYYMLMLQIGSVYTFEDNLDEIIKETNNKCDYILNNINKYNNLIINDLNKYISINNLTGTHVFQYAYMGKNNKDLLIKISNVHRKLCPIINYKSEININLNKNRKINVGFFSNFLKKQHSVCKDRSGIVSNLDRENYNVSYITFQENYEEILANKLKNNTDPKENIVLSYTDHKKNIEIIESLKLDILIYCEIGMDPLNYMYASMRLAPIQCTTWGHSYTSGIDTIDYYLSSKLYESGDISEAQSHYSEKLILFDTLNTYYYDPIINFEPNENLLNEYINIDFTKNVYGCLQSPYKLSKDFDIILKKILEKDNEAIILLSDIDKVAFKRILIPRFEKTIGKEYLNRIYFIPNLRNDIYLTLMSKCDVHIETYPFGSCNSSMDAIRLGKPVITYPSDYLSGRFTYGFYLKMGITDLIAHNIDDFVEKSIKACRDKGWIDPICKLIKEKSDKLIEDTESVEEYNIKLRELFEYYLDNKENMKNI